jgi:multiple sugar transport system ATP-binding protein
MANVSLRNVDKVFGNEVKAVTDFNLEINDKDFIVLVGPSGCGKSTVLNLIAGLEELTSGEIWIDGILANDLDPKDRDIAMVFQNYALYPYMSVYDNIAFGLKMRKVSKNEIQEKVEKTAEILGIKDVLKRKPRELSGGQRQRVAMGRAMVREPKVFLMDEPLSNLNEQLRGTLRREISNLHQRLGATFVYVTHDQTEAMTLGTRIVVMKEGRIQQVGSPQKLHDEPANMFVAGFVGSPAMNFIRAKCIRHTGKVCLQIEDSILDIPPAKEARLADGGYVDKEVILGIRAGDIYDTEEMAGRYPEDVIRSEIMNYELTGDDAWLYIRLSGSEVCIRANPRTPSRKGDVVSITLDPDHIHVFDPETGITITN